MEASELALLLGDGAATEAACLLQGQFVVALNTGLQLVGDHAAPNWLATLPGRLRALLDTSEPGTVERRQSEVAMFCAGVAALMLFVQHNFVGPMLTDAEVPPTAPWHAECRQLLAVDGEDLHTQVRFTGLLAVARAILADTLPHFKAVPCRGLGSMWTMRTLFVHQRCMEANASGLYEAVFAAMLPEDEIETIGNQSVRAALHLECAHCCMYHHKFSRGLRHLVQAQAELGITVSLHGVMGVRTKFQQDEKALMVAKVVRTAGAASPAAPDAASRLPQNVALDDDVLLANLKLSEAQVEDVLTPLEQATVLGLAHHSWRSRPQDE